MEIPFAENQFICAWPFQHLRRCFSFMQTTKASFPASVPPGVHVHLDCTKILLCGVFALRLCHCRFLSTDVCIHNMNVYMHGMCVHACVFGVLVHVLCN